VVYYSNVDGVFRDLFFVGENDALVTPNKFFPLTATAVQRKGYEVPMQRRRSARQRWQKNALIIRTLLSDTVQLGSLGSDCCGNKKKQSRLIVTAFSFTAHSW
jgi:predicted anti-sigma-YlaC factor YlaD